MGGATNETPVGVEANEILHSILLEDFNSSLYYVLAL